MSIVAEGISLDELRNAPEGDELRVYLKEPLSESGMEELRRQTNGMLSEPPIQVGNILVLRFRENQGIGVIPILVTVAGIVVSLVGAVAGWQLFKKTIESSIVPILLVGAGIFLLWEWTKR